jgi:hypothetical protein
MSSFDEIFGGNFDADAAIEDGAQVEASVANEPLPAGEYKVIIETASDIERFKFGNEETSKTGFKLRLAVIEGEYEGRKLFCDVTVADDDQSEKAQKQLRIEMGRLGALVKAVGWQSLNGRNPTDFVDNIAIAKVIVWKSQSTGKIRNFINGWLAPEGGAAVAPKAEAKPAATKAAAVGGAKGMPWMKGAKK